ncbi:hypothetical protein B382_21415 [Stutzerimonas stutzeri B1SMN1]|nr:hypothetical protein B382_21415 [Stutzerimonas stutzeri B1SMN1]
MVSPRAEPVRYFFDLACNTDGISLALNTKNKAKLAGYAKWWNGIGDMLCSDKLGAFAGLHFVYIEA